VALVFYQNKSFLPDQRHITRIKPGAAVNEFNFSEIYESGRLEGAIMESIQQLENIF